MAINCQAYTLNLLVTKLYHGLNNCYSFSNDNDNRADESEVTIITAAGQDDNPAILPREKQPIGDTVLKVRQADTP